MKSQARKLTAVADVGELLPERSPLWELPNVIVSPHAAGGRPLGADAFVRENVGRLVDGEELLNLVEREKGY